MAEAVRNSRISLQNYVNSGDSGIS